MNSLLWWLSGVLCAATVLTFTFLILHRRRQGAAVDAATTYLRTQINDMSAELESAREARDRYFEKIQGIGLERDAWMDLQRRESIGHGYAQDLMMTTIDGLVHQLKALGRTPNLPTVLQAVREEFREKFEEPARRQDPVAVPGAPKPS